MPIVKMPDGQKVNFPDEMDKAEIQRLIATKYPDAVPGKKPDEPAPAQPKQKKQGAISRTIENFGKGVKRIASGDVSGKEVADLAETAVRSAAAPVGGDYVAAGSENIVRALTGQGINPNALDEQRARRKQLGADAPLLAGAAEGASLVAGGAALASKVPALRIVTGGPKTIASRGANAARVAAEAGIVGGVSTLAETGDVGEAAKVAGASAAIGPLAGKALSTVGDVALKAPAYLKSVAGAPTEAAINVISKRAGLTVNQIRGAIDEFVKATGEAPTLGAVMDKNSISKFIPLAQNSTAARTIFEEALDNAVRKMPKSIGELVLGKKKPLSATQVEDAANQAMTAVMDKIGDTKIDYDELAPILEAEGATVELGKRLNKYIRDAKERGYFTIREADTLRQAYSTQSSSSTLDNITKNALKETRDAFAGKVASLSDAYDAALQSYTGQMRRIEGIGVGEGAKSATVRDFAATQGRPATSGAAFKDAPDTVRAEYAARRQQGIAEGRQGDLQGRGTETTGGAVRVADELRQPGPVERNRLALGEAEAERLRVGGEAKIQELENAKRLAPNAALEGAFPSAEMQDAITAIPVLAGRASGGLIAHLASRALGYLASTGVPPNAAKRMAELLTSGDPADMQMVLQLLKKARVKEDVIANLMSKVAADFTGAKVSARETELAIQDLVANGYSEEEARRTVEATNDREGS